MAVNPLLHLAIRLEAVVALVGHLAHSDQAGMRIDMIAIPESCSPIIPSPVVSQSIRDQLDARSRVRHKDEIVDIRIGVEETKHAQSNIVHAACCQLR